MEPRYKKYNTPRTYRRRTISKHAQKECKKCKSKFPVKYLYDGYCALCHARVYAHIHKDINIDNQDKT